jgi:hypothetical protein
MKNLILEWDCKRIMGYYKLNEMDCKMMKSGNS